MEQTSLDKRIEFAERKVLNVQSRLIEQKEKVNQTVKRLERESKSLDEAKKEWIRKRNLEEERVRLEMAELKKAHRHAIEDLKIKYDIERENKLRDIRMLIKEEEKEIGELQAKRSEEALKTRTAEAQIKAQHQVKLNALLRDEQSASRRGVVRQKRILDPPGNVYTMQLERNQGVGMKRPRGSYRRLY